MAEKKPGISPMINMNSSSRKPNPMATGKPAQPALAVAQPYGVARKAAPGSSTKTIDPQFGVTLKKKAAASAIAKKKAAVKREAY